VKYPITPVPAPRQVKSDTWNPRKCVQEYLAFKDEVRLRGVELTADDHVVFTLPMAKSWSKKKRAEMDGEPHLQRPDTDNLWKALADAVHGEDSHLWRISAEKRWGITGSIEITPADSFWQSMGQYMIGDINQSPINNSRNESGGIG